MWNEECGMRNVSRTDGFVYEYSISEVFSFHIPHSTFHTFTLPDYQVSRPLW